MRRPFNSTLLLGVLAAAVALTLGGAVLVVATPAGCQAAERAGMHLRGSTCGQTSQISPGAATATLPSGQTAPVSPTQGSDGLPSPSPGPGFVCATYECHEPTSLPDWLIMGSGPIPGQATLNCRLPIYSTPAPGGGFIAFPGGLFFADPRSAVALPSPPEGYSVNPGPAPSLTYDKAYDRWLPVRREAVSPDGRHYAYTYPGGDGIFVTDVVTGAQSHLATGRFWNVLDVESQGVYAGLQDQPQAPAAGLWLVPFSGPPVQVSAADNWQAVGGGAAYGTAPTNLAPLNATNIILRLDLKDGSIQPWFAVTAAVSRVVGFDVNGHPLILTTGNNYDQSPVYLWTARAPGQPQLIEPELRRFRTDLAPISGAIGDHNGIWLAGAGGTFLVIEGQGTYLAAGIGGQLAGDCS